MIKRRIIIFLLAVLAVSVFSLVGCNCVSESESGKKTTDVVYPERSDLRAQVGYDFELPEWLTEKYTRFSLTDKDGNVISINNNIVFFDKTGDYSLDCGDGAEKLSVYVVDTEEPSLKLIEGKRWDDPTVTEFSYGETIDLDDIFVPIDNSGCATASFTVYEMGGTKVTLAEGNVLTCNLKNVGYYTVETLVRDETGNAKQFTNRIATKRWFDPALGSVVKYELTAVYSWGERIELATSDSPDGTSAFVTMDIMTEGMSSANGTYIRAFANATETLPTGSMITQPTGWNADNASEKFVDFVPVSFKTEVRNGKIEIMWGITGPDSAEIVKGQIFYFRNVQVAEGTSGDVVVQDGVTTWNVPAGWGGSAKIADTSGYAEGTLLDVTMKIKQSGVQAGWNSWLLLKTTGGEKNFTHNTDVVGKNRVDLSTLTGWTEVNGTIAAGSDGALQMLFGTVNATSSDCTVYMKDIVITELSKTATRWDMPYGWGGNTTLADTNYAEGTTVRVTFKVKSLNVSYNNDVVLLINGNVWLTKFRSELNADTYSLRNLSGWTEFTVETTTKANGIIELTFGNIAVEESTMGTVFYKDVVVEEIT